MGKKRGNKSGAFGKRKGMPLVVHFGRMYLDDMGEGSYKIDCATNDGNPPGRRVFDDEPRLITCGECLERQQWTIPSDVFLRDRLQYHERETEEG